jgi:ABC-type Zn uptake system ZnuABC Zn-binding protein ZnuA
MKLFRLLLMVVMVASVAQAKVRVVTTLTDLADFTREVGGDLVEVRSLATGVEDTHGVPMKPSFVPVMNRADLIVLVGFDCEHAFLPALLEASKNPRIQKGNVGYVDCSQGITPVDVPKSTDHSEFTRNRDTYLAKLDAKIAGWKAAVAPLKGTKFVSYHEHWEYFAERFGLKYFATIELKPGIDPTARHVEELITSMKDEHVKLVVREPQFPEKVPRLIAEKTGATLVKLPIMPGGVPGTDTYIEMMDYIINTVVNAVK